PIIDSSGGTWTVDNNKVCYLNGTVPSGCSNVATLLYYTGSIYVFNTFGTWYQWNGSSWTTISGDPRGGGGGQPSADNTMLYDQSYTITDASSNVWYLYYGICYKNGAL